MRPLALAVLLLALTAILRAAPVPKEKPSFEATLRKADDTFRFIADEKAPHFEIVSPSGISSAAIKRKSGDWPAPLTVRFAGMRGLEGFHLQIDKVKLPAFIGAGEERKVSRFNARGDAVSDPKDTVWTITLVRQDKAMEVTVETRTDLTAIRELNLNWVDFYR